MIRDDSPKEMPASDIPLATAAQPLVNRRSLHLYNPPRRWHNRPCLPEVRRLGMKSPMRTWHPNIFLLVLALHAVCFANRASAQRFYPTNVTVDMVSDMEPAAMKQLISDFESHTNLWAPKDLLPIGIGYAGLGRWKDSERVYLRYLKLKPNDPLANRGLATVYSVQERYDEAVKLLEKAWCGGDDQSLPLVGALYMATDQHEKLGKLVPDLLRAKKTAKGILRDNTVSVLVGYAVEAKRFDEKVFAEAIDGVSDDWFLEREETLKVAIKGLRLSGENERADRLSTRAKKNGKGSTGK